MNARASTVGAEGIGPVGMAAAGGGAGGGTTAVWAAGAGGVCARYNQGMAAKRARHRRQFGDRPRSEDNAIRNYGAIGFASGHAVEFGDVGYGPDAYAIEFAARNPVAAHEHGAIAAATQLGCQAFGIGGIGKCPGLHEEGGGCDR